MPRRMLIMLSLSALALLTACAGTREIPDVRVSQGGELGAWLAQQDRPSGELVVQVYRTASGMVFGDAQMIAQADLLREPPADVIKLADTLEDTQYEQTPEGWVALGMDPTNEDHFKFNYRGIQLVIDGEVIIATVGKVETRPDGTPQATLDMVELKAGEYLYLDGRGNTATQPLAQPLNDLGEISGAGFALVPEGNPIVRFQTARGAIEVELYEDEQPLAVAAFLAWIEAGYWQSGEAMSYRVEPMNKLNSGENLRIAQIGIPGIRAQVELPVPPSKRAHDHGSFALVSDQGMLLPGHAFFQLDQRSINAEAWKQNFPVIGGIRKGIDREALLEGVVSGPMDLYIKRAEALRPGDAIESVTVIQQRYPSYAPILEERLKLFEEQ